MDQTAITITVISILTAKGCAVLALWLRLRWRTRHELARQQCITAAVGLLPAGGQLEFSTQSPDGHRVQVRAVGNRGGEAA
ncbi:hypothetical protein [Streptomyces sp. NPDC056713]|uniref:hypothetical protein n=1 Tax=Streptomyces sp. NPDC056713 TaxID=3345921 RepID=UPI0036CFC7B4